MHLFQVHLLQKMNKDFIMNFTKLIIITLIICIPLIIIALFSFFFSKKAQQTKKSEIHNPKLSKTDNTKNSTHQQNNNITIKYSQIDKLLHNLPNVVFSLLKKESCNCLAENKFVLSDLLLFYNYTISYFFVRFFPPQQIFDDDAFYVIQKTTDLILSCPDIQINLNTTEKEIFELQSKRDEYTQKFFTEQITNEFSINDVIDELVFIFSYDIEYNEYIDIDEDSPFLLLGIDFEEKYRSALHTFFSLIIGEFLDCKDGM